MSRKDGIEGKELEDLWARHSAEWRDTAQVCSQWREAEALDPELLKFDASREWWSLLGERGITLLVTREYEHLVMALSSFDGRPRVSYFPLPHPSGLVVDRDRGTVTIASTRNPNQLFEFRPTSSRLARLDMRESSGIPPRTLGPASSRFLPGCLYLHDLALIGGELYGNAVGHNAVVRFLPEGGYERAWWPRCIEREKGPVFARNHLQLNSIAPGADLASSFFSASIDRVSARRPGHQNFPVDRRGVLFSGATREVVARGLTRPHSARLHDGKVWVDNSGYGELGYARDGGFEAVARLPGWTRGLCFHADPEHGDVAFVGTSRVIPRFRQYAPGLEIDASTCGVHAVDPHTGAILASLTWPSGNQIFAIDWLPRTVSSGFPFEASRKRYPTHERSLFYTYQMEF